MDINTDTVMLFAGRFRELQEDEATLARLRLIARRLSPGPYEWSIIRGTPEQRAGWVTKMLTHGSGDIHGIILPKHPMAVPGADPLHPDHAVTLCLTGNGPKSETNAQALIEILQALA
jgi:hypothetical protein